MEPTNSILEDIRIAVGLTKDTIDFDTDLLMHINSAISQLNQVGVGNFIIITDTTKTWEDLQNPLQTEGNQFFTMVPLFIMLNTKIIFDPPPPSTVEHYAKKIDELLWRLKIHYDVPTTT